MYVSPCKCIYMHVKMIIVIIEYKGNCRPTCQNGTLYYVQLEIFLGRKAGPPYLTVLVLA